MLGRRRAVRLLRLEEDPRGDRLALREVLRGRRERVAIRRLQFEPFVVEELEGLLGVLAFLLSLGLLFFPPLCLRLGLLRQEARVRRAVLLIVLFADVLLLRLLGNAARNFGPILSTFLQAMWRLPARN